MKYRVQENCMNIFLPNELDHHNAEEIKKESDQLIERNHIRYVIFDFAETNFMDSSGIGLVMGRYKLLNELGGKLEVTGLSNNSYKVMRLAGLDRIANIKKGEKKNGDK